MGKVATTHTFNLGRWENKERQIMGVEDGMAVRLAGFSLQELAESRLKS